jgi:phosphate transport system substrate-binding protein
MKTCLAILLVAVVGAHAQSLRINGSFTAAQALQPVAAKAKRELGIEVKFNTQDGSSAALRDIGIGAADIAMLVRPLAAEERSAFPEKNFRSIKVGSQVLVPVVSRELWDTGIRAISRAEFAAIYERQILSWKALGGVEREVKFFNPERGYGTWELFATWLYGDARKAPLGKKWEVIQTPKDLRDAVEFNSGAISVVPPKWIDGKHVMTLDLKGDDGAIIPAMPETYHAGKWPIVRPIVIVTPDKPTGNVRKFLRFLVSEKGRAAMAESDFIPRAEAEAEAEVAGY